MFALAILNSVCFDWQARRLVEANINHYMLGLVTLPSENRIAVEEIAVRAARLSCVDERFEDFAAEASIECGPLDTGARDRLRAEIDALVAHGYGLTRDDLEVIFADFTRAAVPPAYRDLVRDAYEGLA